MAIGSVFAKIFKGKAQRNLIFKFSLSISLLVLLFILSVFTGLIYNNRNMIEAELLHRARSHFSNILLTRRWNALYGGVYVEKTEGVESNPYLKNPDIETVEGKVYTKKNPALMTREISELADEHGDYRFHITSLNPINPENRADDFEMRSLKLFEEGADEAYEKIRTDKGVFLRYMGPLVTEESCLQCHAEQGYQTGQIRGGISVTFRIDEMERTISINRKILIILTVSSTLLILGIFYFLIFRLNKNLNDALKTIKDMAERDGLTGLYNRRYLYEWAKRELDRAARYKTSISMIMLDIDYFKQINDEYGHKAGDVALQIFSRILSESGRTSDLSARYGGEEFVIVLTDTGSEGALAFAENLLSKIRNTQFKLPFRNTIHITASLGVAFRNFSAGKEKADLEEFMEEADKAMYKAKETGRNRIEIYKS